MDLLKEVSENTYPGRGIVVGKSEDGLSAVMAYFIMGRSQNSRNRIFAQTADGIETKAFDESKLEDPSLIIYAPVRKLGDTTIVTNGDQTDTVYDYMAAGKTWEEALRTRTFEPDEPNFTPRISALIMQKGQEFSYRMSILKSDNGRAGHTQRFFYDYETPIAGEGHFLHTYRCDGNPIPSFAGDPTNVDIKGDIDTFTENLWNHLNVDNKVSLFVRYITLADGIEQSRIVNKNQ